MSIYPLAPRGLEWRVSRTCDAGVCVMVARHEGSVLLGNTSRPGGPALVYTKAEWDAFIHGVKQGDFDDLF